MAQSAYTRQRLASALGSQSAANELVTIIDAQTGTLSLSTTQRIISLLGQTEGTVAVTAFNAGSALTDPVQGKLAQAIGKKAITEISAAMAL